jgi:hypothetical protein
MTVVRGGSPIPGDRRESTIIAELAQNHHMAFSYEKSGALIPEIILIIMILDNS